MIDARVRVPVDRHEAPAAGGATYERYGEVFQARAGVPQTTADLLEEMDRAGVERAIVHAEYEVGDPADALIEAVAGLVADHPERFDGFGTVSLDRLRAARSLGQVRRVAELGLKGINLQPSFFGLAIDDRLMYPIYAKAEELGLVVGLHTGVNYARSAPIRNERPEHVDQVAADFPDLRIVACHAGWPWVAEMVAILRRHHTVSVDLGGLAPKYLGRAGSGWEVLAQYLRSGLVADQVLLASDWPVMGLKRVVDEWRGFELPEPVLDRVLGGNAARLLARPSS